MNLIRKRSFTLIELILAVSLLLVVGIGLASIDIFAKANVFSSDRRMRLQQEGALILFHAGSNVATAIGNEVINGGASVIRINGNQVNVRVDSNANAVRDAADRWIAYRWDGNGPNSFQVRYCAQCGNANCNFNQCVAPVEVLGTRVSAFQVTSLLNASNAVRFDVTECWDPDGAPNACGTPHNPSLSMTNTVFMPSVSTH